MTGIFSLVVCRAYSRLRGSAFAFGLTAAFATNPPFVVLVFLTSLIGVRVERFVLGVPTSALGLPAGSRRVFPVASDAFVTTWTTNQQPLVAWNLYATSVSRNSSNNLFTKGAAPLVATFKST